MRGMAATLTPKYTDGADAAELTPGEMQRLKEQMLKRRKAFIPKPDLEYIMAVRDQARMELEASHEDLVDLRKTRYRQTVTPPKLLLTLEHTTRIFSGLTNSELNRVGATLTRNMPEWWIAAKDGTQQQFFTTLLAELEVASTYGLMGPSMDSLLECGMVFWETYIRDDIDELDLEQHPGELAADYKKRVAPLFREAGRCVDVRVLDPLSVLFRTKNDKLNQVLIVETKPRAIVDYEYKTVQAKNDKDFDPDEGDPGYPSFWGSGPGSTTGTAETIRYYNGRWYAYICDGRFVEGPVEHGFPRIPITMGVGVSTASSHLSQKVQGILPGIHHLEDSIDTQLTADDDATLTYGRAKFALQKDFAPPGAIDDQDDEPDIDLRDPMKVVGKLPRGSKIINLYAGIDLNRSAPMEGRLRGYWQHSTMNDVASGESPGSGSAGYTVNALQTGALTAYTPYLRGMARLLVDWAEMLRAWYKDLDVTITLPAMEAKAGGQRWLSVKTSDWDDTPIRATISPLSDQQKSAIAAELSALVKDGIISRFTASRANPMVADPEEEQLRIDLDKVHDDLVLKVYNQLLIELGVIPDPNAPPATVPPGATTNAIPGGGSPGGQMPDIQPPPVGAALNQASQQGMESAMPQMTRLAGSGMIGGQPHALPGGEMMPQGAGA